MWRVVAVIGLCLLPMVASAQDIGVTTADSYVGPKGAFINIVTPGGPGARAGLVPGDVVTAADGTAIGGADALQAILARHRAGDTVALHVVHAGNASASDSLVVLAGAPAASAASAKIAAPPPQRSGSAPVQALVPVAPAPAVPRATEPQWAKFFDPNEHAFSLDVPAGWRVQGGSRRMSTLEIRSGVDIVSPDGAIQIFYGDVSVPIYTLPSPLLARAGLRVGSVYSPGYGQQFVVMPYHNGESFAVQWGGQRVGRTCGGAQRTSAQARPDASRGIDQAFAAGGIRTSIMAGEATFSCNLQGEPAVGYVFAATELVRSQASSLWDVKSLVGFVASQSRAAEANALLGRIVASFVIDPGWAARQQQTAAQTSAMVAQTNQVVSAAIAQNGRTLASTSDMIVNGGKARSDATFNAINRYDENAVRGTSTYTSPSGTSKTLDNSYSHQYINNSGQTMGTNSENLPGAGWTEMQRAQPGQ